jgi:hypothetical protein
VNRRDGNNFGVKVECGDFSPPLLPHHFSSSCSGARFAVLAQFFLFLARWEPPEFCEMQPELLLLGFFTGKEKAYMLTRHNNNSTGLLAKPGKPVSHISKRSQSRTITVPGQHKTNCIENLRKHNNTVVTNC